MKYLPINRFLLFPALILLYCLPLQVKASEYTTTPGGQVISRAVMEILKSQQNIRVLIKLRHASEDPWLSKRTTASKVPERISKEEIRQLQGQLESTFSKAERQKEFIIGNRMVTIPWISATITQQALARLRTHANVAMIAEDRREFPNLRESGPLIHAGETHSLGYTGNGIAVAVLDTGIYTGHFALEDDLLHEECFLSDGTCPGGGSRASGPGSANDGDGHGTHVSGIITSTGYVTGIAPDAGIVAVKVLTDSGSGWSSDVIAAIDWVTDNKDAHNIRVINMSLGHGLFTGVCDNTEPAYADAALNARDAGITLFAASGNDASINGIHSPACLSGVIAVGAVYDAARQGGYTWSSCSDSSPKADQIVCFSNVSSKLELLAPGAWITSSDIIIVSGYTFAVNKARSGTSMASPHAAAIAALLLEVNPSLTPQIIDSALVASGLPIFDTRVGRIFPRIDALAAVNELFSRDEDEDGVVDGSDNCPLITNPAQGDLDKDSLGDACDDDIDNDSVPNNEDVYPYDPTRWFDLTSMYSLLLIDAEHMPGDLNNDECVDSADLSSLLAIIRGRVAYLQVYDINRDGAVNIADARSLVVLFTNPRGAPCP